MYALQGESLDRRLGGGGVRGVIRGIPHVKHADDDIHRGDEHDGGKYDVVEDGGSEVVLGLVDVVRRAQYHHDDAVKHLESGSVRNASQGGNRTGCHK